MTPHQSRKSALLAYITKLGLMGYQIGLYGLDGELPGWRHTIQIQCYHRHRSQRAQSLHHKLSSPYIYPIRSIARPSDLRTYIGLNNSSNDQNYYQETPKQYSLRQLRLYYKLNLTQLNSKRQTSYYTRKQIVLLVPEYVNAPGLI